MPPLAPLALRYLLWLVGLRVLYVGLTAVTGLPNTLATAVILAAAPAVDIAIQALRRSTGPIALKGWATIWGVMFAIYVVINVATPALFVAEFRAILSSETGLRSLLTVTGATALMMALFLWIGTRAGGPRNGG